MTENEFFAQLEMRVCGEFEGMQDPALREYWCDGFLNDCDFSVLEDQGRKTGRVWLGKGKSQECWDFILRLGDQANSRDAISWAALMPAADLTGWLTMDFAHKRLTIDPANGHADLESKVK
jgi:hypothetical protein